MSIEGYSFTWFKSFGIDRAIEEKLDRAMSNCDGCMLFPEANVKCLTITVTTLDYRSILLCFEASSMQHRPRKGFKFENAWLIESEFNDFVMEQWHKY